MQLRNTFPVPVAADEAFAALVDLERVAPCMPGAQLTGRDGDAYVGRLKLRVGPVTAAYEGTVTVAASDAGTRTAQLEATGTEIGGQGGASASVAATVREVGPDASEVEVVTDLDVRGKAAQFGRGALGAVTQRILDQFARNLETTLGPGAPAPAAPAATGDASTGPAPAASHAAAPVSDDLDVLRTVALPLLTRAAPVIGAFLAGLLAGLLVGRLTRRPATPPAPWAPPPWWTPPPAA